MPWSFIKFSQLIHEGNVWRSVWRICMWILGLRKTTLTELLTSRFMYWRHHSWTSTVATWRHLMPTYTDSLCVIHKKWFLRLIWLLMKYSLKSTQVPSSNIKSRYCEKSISPMNKETKIEGFSARMRPWFFWSFLKVLQSYWIFLCDIWLLNKHWSKHFFTSRHLFFKIWC